MTSFEQMQLMKEDLYRDLVAALDKQRVHVGHGLCETDVIGVIEKVKFDYMFDSAMEDT